MTVQNGEIAILGGLGGCEALKECSMMLTALKRKTGLSPVKGHPVLRHAIFPPMYIG